MHKHPVIGAYTATGEVMALTLEELKSVLANSEKVKAKAREVYARKKAEKIQKDRENGVWDF